MVMTIVRCFPLCSLFLSFVVLIHIDISRTSYPGYIFLFSGSDSEQENRDGNVEKDLYDILDIPRTASQDEIRRAYKKC